MEVETFSDLVEATVFRDDESVSEDDDETFLRDSVDGSADPSFPDQIVTIEQMTDAVSYWLNDEGRKRRSLASVRSRYRFITSTRQLYR